MLSFINYRVGGSRERRAGATPDASHPNHDNNDERSEHLLVERGFVLRGLRELVANTAWPDGANKEPSC